jgi:hypothetical protein
LDRQVIHRVIVPRPEAVASETAKTVRERFDQEFMVIGTEQGRPQ